MTVLSGLYCQDRAVKTSQDCAFKTSAHYAYLFWREGALGPWGPGNGAMTEL